MRVYCICIFFHLIVQMCAMKIFVFFLFRICFVENGLIRTSCVANCVYSVLSFIASSDRKKKEEGGKEKRKMKIKQHHHRQYVRTLTVDENTELKITSVTIFFSFSLNKNKKKPKPLWNENEEKKITQNHIIERKTSKASAAARRTQSYMCYAVDKTRGENDK